MSLFPGQLKKIGSSMSGLSARFSDNKTLFKGAKVAAAACSIAVAAKLAYSYARKKFTEKLASSKAEGNMEVQRALNTYLETFIYECVLRWLLLISLILLAFAVTSQFNLRKGVLVAFVILGIYSFYVAKAIRMVRWLVSFCRENGLSLNPVHIGRAYLYKAILERVQRKMAGLPFPYRVVMDFFGPKNDKIAGDIADYSIQSTKLRKEALTRIGMWATGWIVYFLIYSRW